MNVDRFCDTYVGVWQGSDNACIDEAMSKWVYRIPRYERKISFSKNLQQYTKLKIGELLENDYIIHNELILKLA